MRLWFLLSFLLVSVSSSCKGWQVQAQAGSTTQYVFRGQKQASASFQSVFGVTHFLSKGWVFGQLASNTPFHKSYSFKGEVLQLQGGVAGFIDELLMKNSLNLLMGSFVYNFYHYPSGRDHRAHELGVSLVGQIPYKPSCALYYNFTEKQTTCEFSLEHIFALTEYLPDWVEDEAWQFRIKGIGGLSFIQKPFVGRPIDYVYGTLRGALEYNPLDCPSFFLALETSFQGDSAFPAVTVGADLGVKFLF